jgi:hypothetical protein
LLYDVGKFVPKQATPARRGGRILSVCEHDMAPNRVSERIYGSRGIAGSTVHVNSHVAEVAPEARLEKPAGLRVERLASRTERLMHNRRRLMGDRPGRLRLQHIWLFFLLAGRTFAAELPMRSRERKIMVRHTDDFVGNTVRLVFERVVDRSDC